MAVSLFTFQAQVKRHQGFTLLELLVVLAIIGILMSLVIGISGVVIEQGKKHRANVEMSAIDLAITRFEVDNDFIPLATNIGTIDWGTGVGTNYTPDHNQYLESSRKLYMALSGRSAHGIAKPNLQIYFPDLKETQVGDVNSTFDNTNSSISYDTYTNTFTAGSYLMDPWGNPYGFYYDESEPHSLNNASSQDVWSTRNSPTNTSDSKYYKKWVKSW